MSEEGKDTRPPEHHEVEESRQNKLEGYEDWCNWLQKQVQDGDLKGEEAAGKIARALLARDLWIERYREQALQDSLTGLPNRRAFDQRLKSAIRDGTAFGLLLIDVDRFKRVNDEYGHLAGDKVLMQIGLFLQTSVREVRTMENHDVIARVGGEEFGLILPLDRKEKSEDLKSIAERIKLGFHNKPLLISAGGELKEIPVTVSIGGGLHQGESAEDFYGKIDDRALYEAKKTRDTAVILPVAQ